jgi:hypothetical protein
MAVDPPMKTVPARLASVVLSLTLAGCVTGLEERAGRADAPPAPLPDFPTSPPVPGMAWIAGGWHWNGADYTWVPGRWESPPPLPVAPAP